MKAVFFDIDGTLISRDKRVPASVHAAIEQLRARGHLAFISSGRTKILVNDPLLKDIKFDGVVSGCGSLIEHNDAVLFYRTVPVDLAVKAFDLFTLNNIVCICEGKNFYYYDEPNLPFISYQSDVKAALGDKVQSITDNFGKWEFSKFICMTDPAFSNVQNCVDNLKDDFNFLIHSDYLFEMVLKGVNKGSAIEIVCQKLGLDIADTFAIGDSVNDMDMLQTAGTAIAMANAPDEVKNAADFVTTLAEDDGIWLALKHFNLIDG